ncbi:MAG: hypothetical protein IAE79_14495 [Anaerolinea sp.]|nr:hypothetical protein [Anaerolinea sp.]
MPHVSERPDVHLFYGRLRLQEWPYGFPQTGYAFLNLSDMRYWVNPRLFYAQIQTAVGHFDHEAIYFEQDVALLTCAAEHIHTVSTLCRPDRMRSRAA